MKDEMASMGLKLKKLESSDADLMNKIVTLEQEMKTFKQEHDQDISKNWLNFSRKP